MNKVTPQENMEARARFFAALGHPVRLLILNLMKVKPRHGEELAEILLLKPATISHHLSILAAAGLVQSQKEQYYQVYSLVGDQMGTRLGELVFVPQPGIAQSNLPGVEVDAYRKKVLDTFFKFGRLVQIPAQQKKFQVILERLAEEFEPGHRYSEREVNQVLLEFHDDVASLRRGMIEVGLMQREKSVYWRVPEH
jgi:ArsR family transcriptional regulator, arsenate/arsenite/antimonite-responsive transcriptional repressor